MDKNEEIKIEFPIWWFMATMLVIGILICVAGKYTVDRLDQKKTATTVSVAMTNVVVEKSRVVMVDRVSTSNEEVEKSNRVAHIRLSLNPVR